MLPASIKIILFDMAGTTVNDTATGKSMVVDALTRSIPDLIDEERSKP